MSAGPQASTATVPASDGTRDRRRRDIQGLRAIAVLLVVLFHAGLPVPGGFVGVDVFFVISGFVITAMLLREWSMRGTLSFRRFYFRRFLRLTPALALIVTVTAAASVFLQNPYGAQQTTARTGIGAMLLSSNFVIANASGDYFAQAATTNPLLNMWSLSVEEQFYLLFPALLLLGWLVALRRRWGWAPVLLTAAITAGSLALAVSWSFGSTFLDGVTALVGGAESFSYYSPFTRAWEFGLGAILALGIWRLPVLPRWAAYALGGAGALLIAVSAFIINDAMPFPGLVALIPVLGTAALIWAGCAHEVGVSRVLATPPFVYVGDVSYSWYLWHWPVIVFTGLLFPNQPLLLVVAAFASFAPALGSYYLVEQPLRKLQPKTRLRSTALVLATFAVPIIACVGLLIGANAGWGIVPPTPAPVPVAVPAAPSSTGPESSTATVSAPDPLLAQGDGEGGEGGSLRAEHVAVQRGCVNTPLDPVRCAFGPTPSTGTVLLAGDSQAYALADGVIDAAAALGKQTVVTSHTGCPFLARESSGKHDYPCGSWQKEIVDYIKDQHPEVVVIANRSGGYVHPETKWRTAARDDGTAAKSQQEAVDLWRKGLEPLIETITKAGSKVVIIAAAPEMTGYADRTSLLSNAVGKSDFSLNRTDREKLRAPALQIDSSLAQANSDVTVFDPFPDLCDDRLCYAVRNGEAIYQDETHLSRAGSLSLAPRLTQAFIAALAGSVQQPQ